MSSKKLQTTCDLKPLQCRKRKDSIRGTHAASPNWAKNLGSGWRTGRPLDVLNLSQSSNAKRRNNNCSSCSKNLIRPIQPLHIYNSLGEVKRLDERQAVESGLIYSSFHYTTPPPLNHSPCTKLTPESTRNLAGDWPTVEPRSNLPVAPESNCGNSGSALRPKQRNAKPKATKGRRTPH